MIAAEYQTSDIFAGWIATMLAGVAKRNRSDGCDFQQRRRTLMDRRQAGS